MKVSILVPIYKVEKFFSKCLESLLSQTYPHIEYVFVNDCTPDNSMDVLHNIMERYPQRANMVRIINNATNSGIAIVRNILLENATGDYILFVDSDDWIDLDMLERMYGVAIKENSDIVICDMIDYYEDGTRKFLNCTKFNSIYNVTPSASNKIFRKSFINNVRFLNGLWYEDFNFTTKLLFNNPKISTISNLYYNCHSRKDSTMNNNNSKKNLDIITIIEDLKQYAKQNNLYDDNIIKYLIFDHILITTINRVERQKNLEKSDVIKKLRSYCKQNLKNYKKQPFYLFFVRSRP